MPGAPGSPWQPMAAHGSPVAQALGHRFSGCQEEAFGNAAGLAAHSTKGHAGENVNVIHLQELCLPCPTQKPEPSNVFEHLLEFALRVVRKWWHPNKKNSDRYHSMHGACPGAKLLPPTSTGANLQFLHDIRHQLQNQVTTLDVPFW